MDFYNQMCKIFQIFLLFYIVHLEMLFLRKKKVKWMNLVYFPIFSILSFILLFTIELIFVSKNFKFFEWST
jgi:hypothetical protein